MHFSWLWVILIVSLGRQDFKLTKLFSLRTPRQEAGRLHIDAARVGATLQDGDAVWSHQGKAIGSETRQGWRHHLLGRSLRVHRYLPRLLRCWGSPRHVILSPHWCRSSSITISVLGPPYLYLFSGTRWSRKNQWAWGLFVLTQLKLDSFFLPLPVPAFPSRRFNLNHNRSCVRVGPLLIINKHASVNQCIQPRRVWCMYVWGLTRAATWKYLKHRWLLFVR